MKKIFCAQLFLGLSLFFRGMTIVLDAVNVKASTSEKLVRKCGVGDEYLGTPVGTIYICTARS